RKADERARAESIDQALTQLRQVLRLVQTDNMTVAEGLSQANQIRSEYLATVGALKDKKTRQIAEKDVYRLDLVIHQIEAAGVGQAERLKKQQDRRPEFDVGGVIPGAMGTPVPMIGHAGEIFINPGQLAGVGAAVMAMAGVPGINSLPFSMPSITAVQPDARDGGGEGSDHFEFHLGIDAGGIVARGVNKRTGRSAVIDLIREYEMEGD
ncbi:MAG: hypothetical protein LC731_04040, partial [Acidobacteria bacterium]|nr:hypothetical protein [Acidobacteriota bacterium]